VIYVESYDEETKTAFRFSLEKFKNKSLIYKLNADVIKWDTISKSWKLDNFRIRTFKGEKENLRSGIRLDTLLGFYPSEFKGLKSEVEMMNYYELNQFIADETAKGSDMVNSYLLEKHRRIAFPFATIILTFIAVPLASRKVRGGIGFNMGIGLGIAFFFIFLMQVSSVFATEGGVDPSLAVWIPNVIFGVLAVFLLLKAPK
jgi:lipopolysaccharide export system permease protein